MSQLQNGQKSLHGNDRSKNSLPALPKLFERKKAGRPKRRK